MIAGAGVTGAGVTRAGATGTGVTGAGVTGAGACVSLNFPNSISLLDVSFAIAFMELPEDFTKRSLIPSLKIEAAL